MALGLGFGCGGGSSDDEAEAEASGGGTDATVAETTGGAESTAAETEGASEEGETAGTDDGADTTTPGDGGSTSASTGEEPPTGDVWVDAKGTVIGYYRVVTNDSDDAVEGLVDFDDVSWFVVPEHDRLYALDTFGMAFFESTDCTGSVHLAPRNSSYGSFREGIVTLAWGPDDEGLLFVVPPGAERVDAEFGSWVDWTYGCLDFESGIFPNPPTMFYAEADVLWVEPPPFVPPLTIEHH
jgi:hypothetical protein